MNLRSSNLSKSGESVSIQRSDDTRSLFAYLMTTCKNVSLYPEDHSISINAIKQFHEKLEAYIRQYGDTRIEFEKDRVICQGVEVQTGPSKEGTLPFTLFRDGIRWLEFTEGIDLEEIRAVLLIIHKYSVLTTEPEGDIVTDFWEAHFNHVPYKADDFISALALDQIDSLSKSDTMHPAVETEIEPDDKPESLDIPTVDSISPDSSIIDPA